MGSICRSEHQLFHLFQALSYVEFVPLLHPAAKSCEALLEIPSACCLCLIVSKQLIVVVLLSSGDVACQMGPTGVLVAVEALSTNSSSKAGYHGCDLQTGVTRIREALSSLTFLMHLPIRQKRGRHNPPICSRVVVGHLFPLNWGLASSSQTVPTGH